MYISEIIYHNKEEYIMKGRGTDEFFKRSYKI